uniref:Uncharacterized protein n=1 Tax=Arundo donax TaxID=35708 RepID=A0A0A9FKM6_ARUDO
MVKNSRVVSCRAHALCITCLGRITVKTSRGKGIMGIVWTVDIINLIIKYELP